MCCKRKLRKPEVVVLERSRALRRTEECLIIRKYWFLSSVATPPLSCSQASGIIVGNLKLERGHILSVRGAGEHFIVSYEIMLHGVFRFCRLGLIVLCIPFNPYIYGERCFKLPTDSKSEFLAPCWFVI